jgi:hypothetical protein
MKSPLSNTRNEAAMRHWLEVRGTCQPGYDDRPERDSCVPELIRLSSKCQPGCGERVPFRGRGESATRQE